MATQQRTIDFILEQCRPAGGVTARKPFGEVALYRESKLIALVCDERLEVKPTPAGRTDLRDVFEAPPYPGAKPSFLIDGETWDDAEWVSEPVRVTTADLPTRAPKKRRAKA